MLRSTKFEYPIVFFANGIGDAILALPAIRALAKLFANRLTLICKRGARQRCFFGVPLRRVIEIDVKRVAGNTEFDSDAAAELAGPCDLFLSLVPWHSKSLNRLMQSLRPAVSAGFFPDYEVALPRDYSKHSSELSFDVPRLLEPTLRVIDFVDPPELPSWARYNARRILDGAGGARVLCVHPDTASEKMWRTEHFQVVLDTFLSLHPEFLAMVIGMAPLDVDRAVQRDRVISCAGLPLETTFALIGFSSLFLGVDSCMLHVADMFRVAGVGLFGPTSCTEFGFRFSTHGHIQADRTMDAIAPLEVISSLESLLERADQGNSNSGIASNKSA